MSLEDRPALNDPTRRPTPWRRGDPLTAKHLDEAPDAIRRIMGGVRRPRQVFAEPRSDTQQIRQMEVVGVEGDYLICVAKNGSSAAAYDAARYTVAKPYLLRRTPFDGYTRNAISYTYTSATARTAVDADEDTETQEVVPAYVAGDVIYATRDVVGGTGVTSRDGTTTVTWLDLNVDGRAWARV